jgi:hypothetical protein
MRKGEVMDVRWPDGSEYGTIKMGNYLNQNETEKITKSIGFIFDAMNQAAAEIDAAIIAMRPIRKEDGSCWYEVVYQFEAGIGAAYYAFDSRASDAQWNAIEACLNILEKNR